VQRISQFPIGNGDPWQIPNGGAQTMKNVVIQVMQAPTEFLDQNPHLSIRFVMLKIKDFRKLFNQDLDGQRLIPT
jgi:hypothetical protein